MNGRSIVGGAVAYGLALSAVVIATAGYYTSLPLLALQVALVTGPSALPFVPIALGWRRWRAAGTIGVALMLAAAWSYVVYVDTRPYLGGGASMAIILGWMVCVALFLVTLLVALFGGFRVADHDDRWRTRPTGRGR